MRHSRNFHHLLDWIWFVKFIGAISSTHTHIRFEFQPQHYLYSKWVLHEFLMWHTNVHIDGIVCTSWNNCWIICSCQSANRSVDINISSIVNCIKRHEKPTILFYFLSNENFNLNMNLEHFNRRIALWTHIVDGGKGIIMTNHLFFVFLLRIDLMHA